MTLNNMLYSFCCFISEGERLRELTVTVSRIFGPEYASRLLWPLAKLSGAVTIIFKGLPAVSVEYVRQHLKDTVAPPVNTLAVARKIAARTPVNNKTCHEARMATSQVEEKLRETGFVDHVFDLELNAMLRMMDST